MIPLRTGVVRDIRVLVYSKVMHLPLGFFSEERKGDIIARMSGDVGEIENSITSSLDMLIKNPILIVSYFATLIVTSWQLTLFTILVLPSMGWLMGRVGRALKRQSLEAQSNSYSIVVWWFFDSWQRIFYRRFYIYILYGNSVQCYQSAEGVL